MVTPDMILQRLPSYKNEWELINRSQYVPDIIREVCTAHNIFKGHYDKFSDLFYNRDPSIVADDLYEFCRHYLLYREEPVKRQTTALPAGIIERGYITNEGVDCKHYALFCSGVISSLNRLYDCCFVGDMLFVGYGKAKEPYHVFTRVQDGEGDIWLDPTPGSGSTPTLIIEKPI